MNKVNKFQKAALKPRRFRNLWYQAGTVNQFEMILGPENKMASTKLKNILRVIDRNLLENNISYALIGAMALSMYGLPRYTSDIDILAEESCRSLMLSIMKRLGYDCFEQNDSFAQFDSELGVLGKIDFMFVSTPDGKEILENKIVVEDPLTGQFPVVQPTDYIVLKLMAIANNPDRSAGDEADIISVLEIYKKKQLPEQFDSIDKEKIVRFAEWFGLTQKVMNIFKDVFEKKEPGNVFFL